MSQVIFSAVTPEIFFSASVTGGRDFVTLKLTIPKQVTNRIARYCFFGWPKFGEGYDRITVGFCTSSWWKREQTQEQFIQKVPLPVISGVITPISRVITCYNPIYPFIKAIYRGPITLLIASRGGSPLFDHSIWERLWEDQPTNLQDSSFVELLDRTCQKNQAVI